MTDLAQKIADAVEVALGDDGHSVVYKNAAVKEAIRQALGSTQERGEAVVVLTLENGSLIAEWLQDKPALNVHLYAHPPADAQRIAELEAQCNHLASALAEIGAAIPGVTYMDPPDGGDVSIAEQVRRMAADLAESREREGRMREAIVEAAAMLYNQKPMSASCRLKSALAAEKE